ncbi:MAG TPA: copper homeostasis protein CutC [Fimbriimonadaceae bacterium]|nr:copper homeostasis protein CutC [Fimbriimonadaceae bacterium]
MGVVLEAVCGSVDEALAAVEAGADRLEVCAALPTGGVTPSLGMIEAIRDRVGVPIVAMIRSHEGALTASEAEIAAMERDIRALPAHEFVFGILRADGTIDQEAVLRLFDAAAGRPCCFHRVFDRVPQPHEALEQLVRWGFRRVLTSGGADSAPEGTNAIRTLVAQAAERITILPGGGIRPGNARALVEATGCDELHFSFRTTTDAPAYPGAPAFRPDPDRIRAIRAEVDDLGP